MGFTKVVTAFSLEYMAVYTVSSDRTSDIRVCLNAAVAVAQLSYGKPGLRYCRARYIEFVGLESTTTGG